MVPTVSELDEMLLRAAFRAGKVPFGPAADEVASLANSLLRAGRLFSQGHRMQVESIYIDAFKKGCMAAIKRIEDGDASRADVLVESARLSVIAHLKSLASAEYLSTAGYPVPPKVSAFEIGDGKKYAEAKRHIEQRLQFEEIAIVEEFQLAFSRQKKRVAVRAPFLDSYINEARLEELRALSPDKWDFARLVRLAEELNTVWEAGAHHSTAMLVRSILDHVPPIFGQPTFGGVANNYSGAKSFKENMKHLDQASRTIADGHLHSQIRKSEVLPNATQVDFRPSVDVLLGEVVRLSSQRAKD